MYRLWKGCVMLVTINKNAFDKAYNPRRHGEVSYDLSKDWFMTFLAKYSGKDFGVKILPMDNCKAVIPVPEDILPLMSGVHYGCTEFALDRKYYTVKN